jgi:formylglycine-generating enzyme required for sulfatase activity
MPVTGVSWHEAVAYCRWLTGKIGGGVWIFSLPTEAEWEKAARGPDGFDYALSRSLGEKETGLYNWKKNPIAVRTVFGIEESRSAYRPNRYGIYHMGGNVVEWTQTSYRPLNRLNPYDNEDRDRDDRPGARVVRGGSWYSASAALLYLAYRDAFQPEIDHHDLGFRIVARRLP